MSVNEDWDVELHKVEYESDEHWELRRKFLLAHKEKFPEDTLVCLAQVFVNVELLGCRYPQETMDLVEELSQDVAAEYREKQKKKLQRTFVEASEAASSKVKGCTAKTSTVTEEATPNTLNHISDTVNPTDQSRKKCSKKNKKLNKKKSLPTATNDHEYISNMIAFCQSTLTEESTSSMFNHPVPNTVNSTSQSRKKRSKKSKKLNTEKKSLPNATKERASNAVSPDYQSSEDTDSRRYFKEMPSKRLQTEPHSEEIPSKRLKTDTYFEDVSFDSLETQSCFKKIQSERLKTDGDVSCEDQDNLFKDIVLWERAGDNATNILQSSAAVSGKVLKWKCSKKENGWECSVNIGSQKLSSSTHLNKKIAKSIANSTALEKLQKCCYTVKVKQDLGTAPKVTVTTEELKQEKKQKSLPDDDWKGSNCIGKKLMTMMGWTGGGLGKSEQGTVEPMSAIVKTQINREGLGLKTNSYNVHEIRAKCRKLFKDLIQSDHSVRNDIVFLDFPKEDRETIHQIARTMGLKSRSQGKDKRKLIVSSKIDVWRLIERLNELGGVTEKYELVKPADEKFVS